MFSVQEENVPPPNGKPIADRRQDPNEGRTRTRAERKRDATALDRTRSEKHSDFEYSVHLAPRGLVRDLPTVFPGIDLAGLHVIPTFQKASIELLHYGEKESLEKDRLLESFLQWASAVRDALRIRDPTAWVDATDPASGLAYFGTSGSPYSDVDGIMRVSTFATTNVGGCNVVQHPEWGYACYPATVFSTAKTELLLQVLEEVNT